MDCNRHEGVITPAQLGALAIEHAGALGSEPGPLQSARDRIEFDAEGRHRPVVDHIDRLHLHHDVLVHRHYQLVVDSEEPRLARFQVGLLHDDGSEGDAVVRIFIGPIPLAARGSHGQVGLREIVLGEEEPEGRDRDGDQDEDRDHGPGDFEQRVVGGAGGLRLARLVEANHHIDQQPEYQQGDKDDDDGDEAMEGGDLLHDRRVGVLEGHLPGRRLTLAGESWTTCCQHRSAADIHQYSIENRHSVTPSAQTLIRPAPPIRGRRMTIDLSTTWTAFATPRQLAKGRAARTIMRGEGGVAPSFVVAPRRPRKGARPRGLCYRFQIIKTIAWQHSRFGVIAKYARSIPVLDKNNVSQSPHAENWPQWSAKAIHYPA